MKTTMFTSLFGAVAVMASSVAATVIPHPEDVWVPKITSPTATTIWHIGTPVNVTWDTSSAPKSISNKFSVVLAGKTLASGFNPLAGFVTVVANSSIPVGTYKLTLFGDSGNQSPAFKVEV